MDFEPHNFPALVTSVIRSDPRLAEPLKEIFAAYARSEDLEEIWARIDSKFHQSLRLILDDLNEIDDPVSLDQEVQSLLTAIDEALIAVEHEAAIAPEADSDGSSGKKAKKAKKKVAKAAGKKAAKKPAAKKKAVKKKAAAQKSGAKKKKAAAPAKKKAAKPAKKKAAKSAAKKPAKKKAAKPAAKKAKAAAKKAKPAKKKAK